MSTKNKHVTYIVTSAVSEALVRGQFEFLASHGYEATLIVGDDNGHRESSSGVRRLKIPMKREIAPLADLVSVAKLWRALRHLRPDITNVGTPKAGLVGGLAAWAARVPYRVYTMRGLRLETTNGWRRTLLTITERIACATADTVLCVSPSLRARALELRLASSKKLKVLGNGSSNGVDFERFAAGAASRRREIRTALRLEADDLVVGFVGRFTRDKGIDSLVSAFRALRQRLPKVRLLLVGCFEAGDPVSAESRAFIETDPGVRVTGFVKDTAPYYAAMDVCALPTFREGFPGVCLESQAAGVPVVTTTATGARDAVIPGTTGLLVDPGDIAGLEAAIYDLLCDSSRTREMGRLGQLWVSKEFSHERVWTDLLHFYESGVSE